MGSVSTGESGGEGVLRDDATAGSATAGGLGRRLARLLGGEERTRVILVLAAVLGLSGADAATVGASATELRAGLHINNTDIGLLVAVSSLVGAFATLPFGVLADRVTRTRVLGFTILLWGVAMLWSATASSFTELLWTRLFLGAVAASAGPLVASLIGDWFAASERGRIYGFVLAGETRRRLRLRRDGRHLRRLVAARAFVVLALPAFVLALARLAAAGAGARRLRRPRARDPAAAAGGDAKEGGRRPRPAACARARHRARPRARRRARQASPDGPRQAARYVLRVRTNIVLIGATACGYYFLAGVQTFGTEFMQGSVRDQPGAGEPPPARRRRSARSSACSSAARWATGSCGAALLNGRILDARGLRGRRDGALPPRAVHARARVGACPTSSLAALLPHRSRIRRSTRPARHHAAALWGRAEAVRTLLRSLAMALAPLLFGAVSDYVFGGGRSGLQWTFVVMLLPLGASAWLLFKARLTYPRDVATAAAVAEASGYASERVAP